MGHGSIGGFAEGAGTGGAGRLCSWWNRRESIRVTVRFGKFIAENNFDQMETAMSEMILEMLEWYPKALKLWYPKGLKLF